MKTIDRKQIHSAMNGHPVIPDVDVSNSAKATIVRISGIKRIPLPEHEVIKILETADPVQFLADVMAGKAIPRYEVNGDNVDIIYEHAGLQDRIKIAKFLVERYLPKVAMVSVKDESQEKIIDGRSFGDIVEKAAELDEP